MHWKPKSALGCSRLVHHCKILGTKSSPWKSPVPAWKQPFRYRPVVRNKKGSVCKAELLCYRPLACQNTTSRMMFFNFLLPLSSFFQTSCSSPYSRDNKIKTKTKNDLLPCLPWVQYRNELEYICIALKLMLLRPWTYCGRTPCWNLVLISLIMIQLKCNMCRIQFYPGLFPESW